MMIQPQRQREEIDEDIRYDPEIKKRGKADLDRI